LLRPTGGSAQEKIQAFEQKLIAVALKDHTAPECYKEKVKAELFQRMCNKFAKEIKYTPEVYNIFTATILTEINQTLLANQKKLENIESLLQPFLTQSNEILQRFQKIESQNDDILQSVQKIENLLQPKYVKKVEITLGTDFDSLSLAQLWEVIEKIMQIIKMRMLRTEAGSIKLIFETTEEGAKKIDLLFRTGKLSQILGIPVEDMLISDSLLQETAASASLSETLGSVAEKLLEKLNALLENPFADWGSVFMKDELEFMKDEDEKAEKPRALIHAYGCRKDNNVVVLEESKENPDELKNDIQIIKSGKPYYLQSLVQNEKGAWIGHGEKIKAETSIPLTIKDPGCESFILLMDQDNDALNESVNIIINALNSGKQDKVFSTTIVILVEVGTGGVK